jgi:hypothetical protein
MIVATSSAKIRFRIKIPTLRKKIAMLIIYTPFEQNVSHYEDKKVKTRFLVFVMLSLFQHENSFFAIKAILDQMV